jgi:mannosyl-oligosaccharide alpha-1,2-mannosidase
MGLREEFEEAVEATRSIDFSTCGLIELNVFETTIRYFGGFLAAYDLCKGKYRYDNELLERATEIGDMLYKAFDTPNRMPVVRWNFKNAVSGLSQQASEGTMLAEIGSLTLEFARLSQITGDPKYFDAVQRITESFESQQDKTKLPGLWPTWVNAKTGDYTEHAGFTTGAMADSMYEYLPKAHILLGGGTQQYRRLYEYAMTAIKRNILFRPMNKEELDILLTGNVNSDGKTPVAELKVDPQVQHLGCFAGGMIAMAGRIFKNEEEFVIGRKVIEGCLWAYEVMQHGIMAERFHAIPCENEKICPWDERKWRDAVDTAYEGTESVESKIYKNRVPQGISKVDDGSYNLRLVCHLTPFLHITNADTRQTRGYRICFHPLPYDGRETIR